MNIAIPMCRNRISPLFEVAESFWLIRMDCPDLMEHLVLPSTMCIAEKCRALVRSGVVVLLCGALSCKWQDYLATLGVEVHAFLSGDGADVLRAFLSEEGKALDCYAMPGRGKGACGQRKRRHRRGFCDFDPLIQEK